MTGKPLDAWKDVRPLGRVRREGDGVRLFWPGSGLIFCFRGKELSVGLEAGYAVYESWVSVHVDGVLIARFPVPRGESEWRILGNGTGEDNHLVRVTLDTQPMAGDPGAFLRVTHLCAEGEVTPAPAPRWTLEFVGDSLTSGEGSIGAVQESEWIPTWFHAGNAFPCLTSELLGADWRVVSQSGWGIRSSWDNHPECTLGAIYPALCSLQGAEEAWNPGDAPADAVVINLGTNDEGAFHQPPWTDPKTGETFGEHLTDDGGYDPDCLRAIREAQAEFLTQVRRINPEAQLVWCYGLIPGGLGDTLREGVALYRRKTGDERAWYLQLPAMLPQDVGARSHPGVRAHAKAARALADFLEPLLSEREKTR